MFSRQVCYLYGFLNPSVHTRIELSNPSLRSWGYLGATQLWRSWLRDAFGGILAPACSFVQCFLQARGEKAPHAESEALKSAGWAASHTCLVLVSRISESVFGAMLCPSLGEKTEELFVVCACRVVDKAHSVVCTRSICSHQEGFALSLSRFLAAPG